MKYKAGFIGTGVMGGAIARAVSKNCPKDSLALSNIPQKDAETLAKELGCLHLDNAKVAGDCEYIYLAVKPQVIKSVMEEISPVLKSRKDRFVLVSMAAGISIATLKEMADLPSLPVIRIMPNTAALVESAVVLCSFSEEVTDSERDEFLSLSSSAGMCDPVPEKLIDAAGSLTGCGPAFAFVIMQALADGAVACGVDRERARRYAAMTLLGSAKLALESGKHLEQLKDEVCSPGGSTIMGVKAMEESAVRAAMIKAVAASFEKNKELGKV